MMRSETSALQVLPLLLVCTALLLGCAPLVAPAPTVEPTVPARMPTMPPEQDSWILVDLPPDATQLQHGAEIYRLVCSACHAHSGEGLTDAWRATWDPQDQNCWQSKCHAANHPPDGFELPIAPAIVGRQALAPFATAAELHAYIQAAMPWQHPNGLTEEEGWAVTAYVIKLNRMNPGPELTPANAAQLSLHPQTDAATPVSPADGSESTTTRGLPETGRILAGAALVGLAILLALRVTLGKKKAKRQ